MSKQLFNLFSDPKKKLPDLAAMWETFKSRTPEALELEKKIYTTGQHQPIGNKLSEHGEAILHEKEKE